jgi:hypothetical protein
VSGRTAPFLLIGLLLFSLPLALSSVVFTVAVAALAVLVLMLAVLGLDRTSVWLMVASVGLAPCVKFVFPGFLFFDISDGLFIIAVALAVPRLVTRHVWLPKQFVFGSLAFVTLSVLASLHSATPGRSFYYGGLIVFTFVGLPALLVWWSPSDKVVLALALAYAAGTGASVLVGLTQTGSRSTGLTNHPNILGYTAVLALSLVPFLAKALAKPYRTPICMAVFVISFVGIMTSGSRAALLTALTLIVLVPAAERSIFAALAVIGAGLLALLYVPKRIAAGGGGHDALSRLLGGASDAAQSNTERVSHLEKTWASAVNHPFLGTGFSYVDFFAHNAYVQIAAAAGFIGLAAFAVVCLSMVRPLFVHGGLHSRLVYPAVVFMVAAPVSPMLIDRYIGFLLGLSMVGAVAMHEGRRKTGQDDSVNGPAGEPLTATARPL